MTKILENFIAVVIAMASLILLPLFLSQAHFARCFSVTGKTSVTELAAKICKEKEITLFTYDQHADELYQCGYEGGLEISYYVYETVADEAGSGSEQRKYVTTWEEIREELISSSKYKFPDGAYVCITARAYSRKPNFLTAFVKSRIDCVETSYIERGGVQ